MYPQLVALGIEHVQVNIPADLGLGGGYLDVTEGIGEP